MLEDQPQQIDEPVNLVVSHLEGIGVRDQHAGSRRDPGRQAVLDEEDRFAREAVFNLLFQVGGRNGDGGRPRDQRLGERKKILRWNPGRDREFRELPDQIIEIDQVGDPGRQAKRLQLPEIKTRLESIEHGDTHPDFLLAEHCPDGDLSLTSRRGIERAVPHPVERPVLDREIELHPTALFIVHLVAPFDVGHSTRLVPCHVNSSRIAEATLFRALEILFIRGCPGGAHHDATSAAPGVGEGEPHGFRLPLPPSSPLD